MPERERRPSIVRVTTTDRPPPEPAPAASPDPAAIGEAAARLQEPLARLASAVQAAQAHLVHDPDRVRHELDRAREALDALDDQLARWSRP